MHRPLPTFTSLTASKTFSLYTSICRRTFSYAAPQIWNDIPLNITISPSVSAFKRKLKTHYFPATCHQWQPVPPILPADRHYACYKCLYCIV